MLDVDDRPDGECKRKKTSVDEKISSIFRNSKEKLDGLALYR
jgi:hypothetical protein